jgi:O-antigen ligase
MINTAQVGCEPQPEDTASSCMSLATLLRLWFLVFSGPQEPQARRIRQTFVDVLVVCFGIALPWSTTAASALSIMLVIAIPPTLNARTVLAGLRQLSLLLPLLFVGLAALGTLWAWEVDWLERLHAVSKMTKLLLIPLLFFHFQSSPRYTWAFFGIALSSLFLLFLSFIVSVFPEFASYIEARGPGVPVRNYIDQSQGFAFLAFALSGLATESVRQGKVARSIVPYLLSAAFIANLAFVNVARTAFAYVPVMLALFARRYTRGTYALLALVGFAIVGTVLVLSSPNLQRKVARIPGDVVAYRNNSMTVGDDPASGAQRLTFWRDSLAFIRSAPLLGHGTGSIKTLYEGYARGRTGLDALVVADPHNQTLNAAVQWGIVGCLILLSMWGAHVWLFREAMLSTRAPFVAWIGLLAVAQNIASSLFNSHLQGFYPGWLYVFAVGTAGGALQRIKSRQH